jgi:hypothetical protein
LILSSSFLSFSPKAGLCGWEETLNSLTQAKFRRADRFSHAVLAGALSCLKQYNLQEFSLYFGTSNGSIESVKNSQDNIFQNQFPMPFAFINTLSSTPLFFLLQYLNIQTAAISIAHSQFAFENALSLALIDLKQKRIKNALVGVCDVWCESVARSCKIDNEAYEFSAWISYEYDERDCVKFFGNFNETLKFIKRFKTEQVCVSPNFPQHELEELQKTAQVCRSDTAKTAANCSAAVICEHFANSKMPLFYIGYDKRGGYSFVNIN